MQKTIKIAISLPKEDFEVIEKFRRKAGIERSAIIDKAIRFWLKHLERERLIKRYVEGYRKKPESIEEIGVLEKMSADAFESEGLK